MAEAKIKMIRVSLFASVSLLDLTAVDTIKVTRLNDFVVQIAIHSHDRNNRIGRIGFGAL